MQIIDDVFARLAKRLSREHNFIRGVGIQDGGIHEVVQLTIPVRKGHREAFNRDQFELGPSIQRPFNDCVCTQVPQLQPYIGLATPLCDVLPIKDNIRLPLDFERETFLHFVRRNHEVLLLCDA